MIRIFANISVIITSVLMTTILCGSIFDAFEYLFTAECNSLINTLSVVIVFLSAIACLIGVVFSIAFYNICLKRIKEIWRTRK